MTYETSEEKFRFGLLAVVEELGRKELAETIIQAIEEYAKTEVFKIL